jgi:hypothetical protein
MTTKSPEKIVELEGLKIGKSMDSDRAGKPSSAPQNDNDNALATE